jgi:hypothetical protein
VHWHAVWRWLVAAGLYRDLVATTIALGGARLIAWRPLRKHLANQERTADLLDTKTPGGLHDLLPVRDVPPAGRPPDASPPVHPR